MQCKHCSTSLSLPFLVTPRWYVDSLLWNFFWYPLLVAAITCRDPSCPLTPVPSHPRDIRSLRGRLYSCNGSVRHFTPLVNDGYLYGNCSFWSSAIKRTTKRYDSAVFGVSLLRTSTLINPKVTLNLIFELALSSFTLWAVNPTTGTLRMVPEAHNLEELKEELPPRVQCFSEPTRPPITCLPSHVLPSKVEGSIVQPVSSHHPIATRATCIIPNNLTGTKIIGAVSILLPLLHRWCTSFLHYLKIL